jgi:hypothetical protein
LELFLEIPEFLVREGLDGGSIDYALFFLYGIINYVFSDSGFTCTGGGRDDYRTPLIYIINCFLLKAVINHRVIII